MWNVGVPGGIPMSPRPEKNADRKRQLRSEARAWREVAERIDANGLAGHGLCYEIFKAFAYLPIEVPMKDRVYAHLSTATFGSITLDDVEPVGPYVWRGEGDHPDRVRNRVLACLFMALEAEDEAKSEAEATP
jgi:hypothetical protein